MAREKRNAVNPGGGGGHAPGSKDSRSANPFIHLDNKERQDQMAGKYTEFEKQADGNLRIVLLPEAREDVEEIASKKIDADSRLAEVIEWQLANGWSFVRPEVVAALTDAPILSEEVETDEQGEVRGVGTVYWYPQYDVRDPVEQLLHDGSVDFVRGE